ncbi:hypothetical protein MBLNU230_g3159t1 [Neophaeotheca triangularis]
MADADLEEIRRARLQQLQEQGGGSQPSGNAPGNASGSEGQSEEEQKQSQQSRMRESILSQILEPAAADRLGRIRLVKASRAEDVENRLIALARSGQLRARVGEEQLKEILNAVSEQQEGQGGGDGGAGRVVQRRKAGGWDEDDLDDLLRED